MRGRWSIADLGRTVLDRLLPRVDDVALALLSPGPGAVVRREGARSAGGDRTYVAHRAAAGATVFVPARDRELATQVLAGRPGGPRALAVRSLRAALPAPRVSVRGARVSVPRVVAAAVPDRPAGRCCLLVGGGGPRRRGAFLVAPDDAGAADLVVKAAVLEAAERGAHEQRVLGQVHALSPGLGPRGVGHGTAGTWSWSAETLVPGRPLSETVTDVSSSGRARTREVLEQLARALASLTRASTGPGSGSPVDLRGRHSELTPLVTGLGGVPRVLVHGDLATAHNLLVEGSRVTLIDWETARPDGLPLLDLLPVLCLATARAAGRVNLPSQADYVLALCAGTAAESAWLLGLVADYCRRSGVPLEAAGRLAMLTWGHVASMPLVHAELTAAHEGAVDAWPTPADLVAQRWATRPDLGLEWPALLAASRRS